MESYPWIVLERDNEILGYAYASAFRTRQAYSWSVESTVYVKNGHHGQGHGKKLYLDLFRRLKEQGAANVIGGLTIPNPASIALHESLGFKQVALLKNIGFKLGKWWDVGYWMLELQELSDPLPLRKPKL